jgi:hypothetical protein
VLVPAACGSSAPEARSPAPPPSTSAKPPTPEAPEPKLSWAALRSGAIKIESAETLSGRVSGYVRDSETETFRVDVPASPTCEARRTSQWIAIPGEWSVGVLGAAEAPEGCVLWIRRKLDAQRSATDLRVEVTYLLPSNGRTPQHGARSVVNVAAPKHLPSSKNSLKDFYRAFAEQPNLAPLRGVLSAINTQTRAPGSDTSDWSQLVSSVTGYSSLEASLQADRTLAVSFDSKRANVPMTSLRAPQGEIYPWQRMLSQLPASDRADLPLREPLARVTPADFYFVRAADFAALESLAEEADNWLTPAIHLLEGGGRDHDLAKRYRAQLGLNEDAWSKLMGPELISDMAIVGSDPFLRQGSDVSVLIRPKNPRGLVNALNAKAASFEEATLSETDYRGVEIVERRDQHGDKLRQYTVHLSDLPALGPLTVVSNSPAAVRRILDVVLDGKAALNDEPDFQYMLARDAKQPARVLAFGGERFIQSVIRPEKRILDARRQIARAELTRVSYAALLFGWLMGREPRDTAELLQSPWLEKGNLRHFDGQVIEFEVGGAPHSAFGVPAFLTPVIDLPVPKLVTAREQAAYQAFSESYSAQWRRFVDPIALRVESATDKTPARYHLRVLPLLLSSSDYQDILEFAGDVHVSAAPVVPGLQATLGIAKDSPFRQMLTGRGQEFLGHSFGIDWVGDWVAVGVADSPKWIEAARSFGDVPELAGEEPKNPDELWRDAPVYAALDIKRPGAAALVLTSLRKMAEGALSEGLDWREQHQFQGHSIMRVGVDDFQLFYALTKDRLYIAGQSALVERLISKSKEVTPKVTHGEGTGGQLDAHLAPLSTSPLLTAVIWATEREMRRQDGAADGLTAALLRGSHKRDAASLRALGFDYLGYVPSNVDGRAYQLTDHGIVDPDRGNVFEPIFPSLPVSGSALDKVLGALRRLSVALAFETEPGVDNLQSLRTLIEIQRTAH